MEQGGHHLGEALCGMGDKRRDWGGGAGCRIIGGGLGGRLGGVAGCRIIGGGLGGRLGGVADPWNSHESGSEAREACSVSCKVYSVILQESYLQAVHAVLDSVSICCWLAWERWTCMDRRYTYVGLVCVIPYGPSWASCVGRQRLCLVDASLPGSALAQ